MSPFSFLPKNLWDSLQAAELSIFSQQSLDPLQNLSGVDWSPGHIWKTHITHYNSCQKDTDILHL